MTPLIFTIVVTVVSVGAGLLGALVGVGGGIIEVPLLSLFLGVEIHHAVAASLISVIATSNGAASAYVRSYLSNLRLAMFLEIATVAGALCGAFLAAFISPKWLFLLFGAALVYTAISMSRRQKIAAHDFPQDPLADRLRLHGIFHDLELKQDVIYRVSRTKLGFGVSYLAGIVSGMLGVGGGIVKVPLMNLAMGVPMKAATATSNFMIGITAAASAAVYFARGDVQPFIAAPVAVGVLLGAKIGAKMAGYVKSDLLRWLFVAVLAITAAQMLMKGMK